jgi:hypothetical protein
MPKHIFTINPQSIQKEKKEDKSTKYSNKLIFLHTINNESDNPTTIIRNIINTLERRLQLSYPIVLWTVFGLQYILLTI